MPASFRLRGDSLCDVQRSRDIVNPAGAELRTPSQDEQRERAKRLRVVGEAALQKRLAAEIGATRQVLIESATQGRTEHFLPVAISGETPGAVMPLVITGSDGARLTV